MTQRVNEHGQTIGAVVPNWTGAPEVPHTPMQGRFCDVVPLSIVHGPDLFAAYSEDIAGGMWTYMPAGPFVDKIHFDAWLSTNCESRDPLFFAVIDKTTGTALGMASFLRIQPENGVVEVGHIAFSPRLQRTAMATEAMFLMMKRILGELGYRRYEWKCDALNAPSQAAAKRLGFTYDGLFRQALVYKGRNRDTAWFSILDGDWPRIEPAFEAWLSPENFDHDGAQRQPLQARATG